MGRTIVVFVLIIAVIFAAGCRGGAYGEVYVEDDHYHHEPDHHDDNDDLYLPWLLGFNVVDSLGNSTEDYVNYVAELDPYIDEGFFEVYWDVDAVNNYIVEYRINDIPDVVGSRLIDAEVCGWGLPCDASGYQFCQYNPDFTLSCDVITPAYADIDSMRYPLDISDMVYDIPETLYLILQICDTRSDYCEFEALPALFF